MIIYKEPIKKQNDETWGQIPVPMFFFCEATKIHGSHGRHGSFLRWCFGKGHTEINHRNLYGIYTDFFKVTQKAQKFLSTDHTENTEKDFV